MSSILLNVSVVDCSYNNNGEQREYIYCGSTLSEDGHAGECYDFCISNPPFGTPWKEDLRKRGLTEKEKKRFRDSRFYANDSNGQELSFLPDIGDCQMLFLANNLSRMQTATALGTRIVEVHNGSSLFTGNAGGGASNLRRHIIENDLLEAIIAMPENEFYNTGIGTYIWVVTNRKEPRRKGYVQLIDATEIKTPLRKNLGKKNCETNADDRRKILQLLLDFRETDKSKIFPNAEFGYWQITVCRPLRLVYEELNAITLPKLKNEADVKLLNTVREVWCEHLGGRAVSDYDLFFMLAQHKVKVTDKKVALIREHLGTRRDDAEVCYVKPTDLDSAVVVAPEKEQEQVPLLYPGGIDAFMANEVLPYAPDAFVDTKATVIGYELSFTKYFYKPVALRPLSAIVADICGIEEQLRGNLNEILNI